MSALTRMHTCLTCGAQWESSVEFGATPRLSGELRVQCECGSTAIASAPIPIVIEFDKSLNNVTRALQVLGFRDAQCDFSFNEEIIFTVHILLRKEHLLEFYLQQRETTYRVLGSAVERKRTHWEVSAEVTRPGTHWEPVFSDVVDIAEGGTVEVALIEAVLSYFRNTMYDCMPQIEPNLDPTMEDVPQ